MKRGPKPRPRISEQTTAKVTELVASGVSIVKACRLSGVSRETWYRHLRDLRTGRWAEKLTQESAGL